MDNNSVNMDRSRSDSTTLLNNSSALQHGGYGSLNIYHTPPLPGGTPQTHTPSIILNDDFYLNSRRSISPHTNINNNNNNNNYNYNNNTNINNDNPEYSSLPFSSFNPTINQSNNKSINMTPQESHCTAISSASSYSQSPSHSNTDFMKHSTNNKGVMNINHTLNEEEQQQQQGDDNNNKKNKILQPIMNILNAGIGLAFLSQPYAIAHGGWSAIIGFIIINIISYHCCRIYVKVFRRYSYSNFTFITYPQLGFLVSGSWSYYLILIFSVCELVGISCVYIIFFWNNSYYLLCRWQLYGINGFIPGHYNYNNNNNYNDNSYIWSLNAWSEIDEIIIISFCCLSILPSILIIRITQNSLYHKLSYIILFAIILLSFTLLTFIILHIISHEELAHHGLEKISIPSSQSIKSSESKYWITNFSSFSISCGIFLFCFSSCLHSKLPIIKNTIKDPLDFKKILRWSFLLLFIMYVLIGIEGYLLFGKSAHSIILRNIMHHCKNIGLFCDLVCIFFIITAYLCIIPLLLRISTFIEFNIIYEFIRNRKRHRHYNNNIKTQKIINYNHHKNAVSMHSINSTNSMSENDKSQTSLNQTMQQQHIQQITKQNTNTTNTTNTTNSSKNTSFDDVIISNCTKRISRIGVFILLLLISYMFRNKIIFLESICGICFISTSTILIPCFLYLKSFWNTLSCCNKFAHILLIVFIIIIVIALFIGSIIDLIA